MLMCRCNWVNLDNELYVKYHDYEWGVPVYDDYKLFEALVLEMFQAGLSWECILNKRVFFREDFANFDYDVVALYDDNKVESLLADKRIVRNRLKIKSAINNACVFIKIRDEYGSFSDYIWHFTNNEVIYPEYNEGSSELSDVISRDLISRGMRFVGSKVVYSYLEAIGVINNHGKECYKYKMR